MGADPRQIRNYAEGKTSGKLQTEERNIRADQIRKLNIDIGSGNVKLQNVLGNHIIRAFETAADGLAAVLVQIPMQLQNDRWLWRDIVVALVDRRQHVAVSGDLFFAAALGIWREATFGAWCY